MKERLMAVGGYLLAGLIVCATLLVVAERVSSGSPLPVTAASEDAGFAGEEVPHG